MTNQSAPVENKLPFDPLTMLTRLWMKKSILIKGLAISMVLAICAGYLFGKRVYESETVLMYSGVPGELKNGIYKTPTLLTYMNLVKIPANLEKVRERLKVGMSIQSLGSAFSIQIQRDTALLFIRARSSDPEMTARMANMLRDVFIESVTNIGKQEGQQFLNQNDDRLTQINVELTKADKELEDYRRENNVIDIDKEAQWLLDENKAVSLLLNQAQIDKTSAELQLADLDNIMNNLKAQIQKEQSEAGELEGIGQAKIKADRLREKIAADKDRRFNQAKLVEKEIEYERIRQMYEKNYASKAELDHAKAELDSIHALASDTDQIKEWKSELESLDKLIVPKGSDTASAPILREMMLKSFDLQLETSSLDEKIVHLQKASDDIQAKLNNLPSKQKTYVSLSREVVAKEMEKQDLSSKLAMAQNLATSGGSDFSLIAEASVPVIPIKSSRRAVAMAVLAAGSISVFLFILAVTLMDSRLHSASELRLKLDVPLLAVIPHTPHPEQFVPFTSEPYAIEELKLMLIGQSRELQKTGYKLLVTSGSPKEGTTVVARSIAAVLEQMGYRTTCIDAKSEMDQNQHLLDSHVMVIDGPAMLDSSESVLFSRRADGIIFVVNAQHSTLRSIRKTLERIKLTGVPLLGIILNDVDSQYLEKP